jgi:hypothetical protein
MYSSHTAVSRTDAGFPDFDNPSGALLGLISAAFSIGAVLAIPVVP